MDIVFVPCNYHHQLDGGYDDEVHPDCVWDQQEQLDYLGPLDLTIYITEDSFIQN